MKRKALTLTAAAAVLLAAAAFAGSTYAHGPGWALGQGSGPARAEFTPAMMGGGMGPGHGHGHGMMGNRPGQGMMGQGPGFGMAARGAGAAFDCPQGFASADKDLTVEDVSAMLERRLDRMNNDRLKLGDVSLQGDDTIIGEIVTLDGSVVDRLEFDRDTGQVKRVK